MTGEERRAAKARSIVGMRQGQPWHEVSRTGGPGYRRPVVPMTAYDAIGV